MLVGVPGRVNSLPGTVVEYFVSNTCPCPRLVWLSASAITPWADMQTVDEPATRCDL